MIARAACDTFTGISVTSLFANTDKGSPGYLSAKVSWHLEMIHICHTPEGCPMLHLSGMVYIYIERIETILSPHPESGPRQSDLEGPGI